MTYTSAINANRIKPQTATYNAVKIQVNNPQTNIPEGFKTSPEDNGTYNAVAIEVNNPKVNTGKKHHHCVYNYPCAECLVTADKAPIYHVRVPKIPVAYQTTNFINNRTLINAGVDFEKELNNVKDASVKVPETTPEAQITIIEEITAVPAPKLTTTEEQKETPEDSSEETIFKGTKKPVEIIPSIEIKPSVDITKTIKNLSNENFDIQAQQMEDIAKASMEDTQKAVPYIVTEIFAELINIVNKDSSKLVPPSEKQIEKREQIIINELVREKSKSEGIEDAKIELPYKITEEDLRIANELSPMEQAERNKEYALYTLAILSKVYTDEVQRHTGNVVPLTDLPGVSEIVDTLKKDNNPSIKVSAIDALRYLNKPEYKDEIKSVLEIATKDSNRFVAENAAYALKSLEK